MCFSSSVRYTDILLQGVIAVCNNKPEPIKGGQDRSAEQVASDSTVGFVVLIAASLLVIVYVIAAY